MPKFNMTHEDDQRMIFVCFLVIFDSFSVEPQEIPLPDTFINPAFQVAHHLW